MPTPLIQYTFSGTWGKTQVLGTTSNTGKTGLGAALKHGPIKTMGLDTAKKPLQASKKVLNVKA